MFDIDTEQWRVMHTLCVRKMIRSSGAIRMDRRSDPVSRRGEITERISSILGYALMSVFIAFTLTIATYPVGEFLVICFLSLIVYGGVSEQCSSYLYEKKELYVFGALPISAATHLASKISGTIAYYMLVCSALIAPAFFVILVEHGLMAGFRWIVTVTFCVPFICLIAMCAHSLSTGILRERKSRLGLTRSIVWSCMSAIFVAICIVLILPNVELSEFGKSWNLQANPLLLLFPPYWFVALLLVLEGQFNFTSVTGAIFAVFGGVALCLFLIRKGDTAVLAALGEGNSEGDRTSQTSNSISKLSRLRIGSLGYERVAMWNLAFLHLKHDSTFHSFSFFYLPALFVSFALVLGITAEPIVDPISNTEHARLLTWSSCFIFFYQFVIYEALRTSSYAPASWVLLVSPSEFTRYTALTLDWLYLVFTLPILALICIVLSYFLPSQIDALFHTITLGWLSYAAINLKSIVNPALPFNRQISSSRASPRLCLNFLLVVVAGIVVFHALASWIYTTYTTYIASILLGAVVCVALRYLAGVRYDRKFLNADLVT